MHAHHMRSPAGACRATSSGHRLSFQLQSRQSPHWCRLIQTATGRDWSAATFCKMTTLASHAHRAGAARRRVLRRLTRSTLTESAADSTESAAAPSSNGSASTRSAQGAAPLAAACRPRFAPRRGALPARLRITSPLRRAHMLVMRAAVRLLQGAGVPC